MVPAQCIQRLGNRLTTVTSSHQQHMWHWNHHLDCKRNLTAAKRIKWCHFIALRTFVQAVSQDLSKWPMLSLKVLFAALKDFQFQSCAANRSNPLLIRRHRQTSTDFSRYATCRFHDAGQYNALSCCKTRKGPSHHGRSHVYRSGR